ncbi:hypothetical protein [Corynebacterium parakroppenstedtii]|uniref:hypothetical protein n=1 Tax=Corynebacterium parakroppenstedtii TaxID=2828363 RepID=UPI00079A4D5E|nr:hypothetical protein [Corynebacterium parakroppenstedtii]KXB50369.1 hypothetical protein HMPREF1861_01149 [Corynebacterium kroppenstedtii]MCF7182851.1 hypothetical protein [Corynebacterium parakroppenstedtii]
MADIILIVNTTIHFGRGREKPSHVPTIHLCTIHTLDVDFSITKDELGTID